MHAERRGQGRVSRLGARMSEVDRTTMKKVNTVVSPLFGDGQRTGTRLRADRLQMHYGSRLPRSNLSVPTHLRCTNRDTAGLRVAG